MPIKPDCEPLANKLPAGPLADTTEVLEVMHEVETVLEPAGLGHLLPFNGVYRELTSAVHEGVQQPPGRFRRPDTVSRTVGIFADEYYAQLRAYVKGDRAGVARAWRPLIYDRAAKMAPQAIQFGMGMGAHIMYDLSEALKKSANLAVDDGFWEYYERDYMEVIGDMIKTMADELSPSYVPVPLGIRERITSHAVITIASWRDIAWRNGQRLQAANGDTQRTSEIRQGLDRSAERVNRRLLYAGSLAMGPFAFPSRTRRASL